MCSITLPVVGVGALRPKEVYVVFEGEFKDKLLLNGVLVARRTHCVAQQRQAGQGELVLVALVEVQAEGGEHHPEFLPA